MGVTVPLVIGAIGFISGILSLSVYSPYTLVVIFSVIPIVAWYYCHVSLTRRGLQNLFHPINFLLATYLFVFLSKTVYILLSGTYGPVTYLRFSLDENALFILTKAHIGIVIGITIAIVLSFRFGIIYSGNNHITISQCQFVYQRRRVAFVILLVISFLITCFAYLQIYVEAYRLFSPQDLTAFIRLLGSRHVVFWEKGYLTPLLFLFKASFFIWTAFLFSNLQGISKTWWGLWAITIIFDLLSGIRSNVIFLNMLIVLGLYHFIRSRVSITKAITFFLVVFLIFGITYRIMTRDVFYTSSRDLAYIDRLMIYDLPAIDSFMIVLDKVPRDLEYQWGKTFVSLLAWPIPRFIYPDKPGGGNSLFTKTFFPEYYYPNRVEIAVSVFGDSYINFGWMGVLLVSAFLGIFLGILYHKILTPVGLLTFLTVLMRVPSLFRGDLYNALIYIATLLVPLYASYIFFKIICALTNAPHLSRPRRNTARLGNTGVGPY